ncbi:hypothetical protein TSMG150 [Halocynthia phage JM-2012]|uniref:hypothetical protein n=1 Tax=Halocynthia phage JM-2012 TaxID=1173297 RepID=UPI00025C6972|nr:hypothetical protein TSMG150 [Halocynthia phage JM-2012]AFI55433.1 hypothetical protein TSMG150 [Halocynthia phage JM-2012]
MKKQIIEADKLTFIKLNVGSQPTVLEFTGLAHSILEDIYIEGNVDSVNAWPSTVKKLTLFNSGYLDTGILPNGIERLSLVTETCIINEFPQSLKHLLILGCESYPNLSKLTGLEYLTIRDQRVSLFDLPIGNLDYLSCSPEEERPDFSIFKKLRGLSVLNAQCTILDFNNLNIDTLEIRKTSAQEIRNIPNTVKCFTLSDSKLKERNYILPEELRILTQKNTSDFDNNVLPFPKLPSTVLYVNGSSMSSRR